MHRNFRYGLFLSVIVHCCFGLWLARTLPPATEARTPPLVTLNEASTVLKNEAQKKTKSNTLISSRNQFEKSHSTTKARKKGRGKGNSFAYKDFAPSSFRIGTFEKHKADHNDGWTGNEVMETMNGMGLSEYSENYYFFDVLVSHLNRMIPYPKELWEHKIEGKVWVKLQVNRRGQLLRVIDSSKNCPVLSAYILINIYQALKVGLPKRFWYRRDKDLNLFLSFDYSVTSIPTSSEVQVGKYFKNRLEFKRVAKVPSFLHEKMQEYARYIPPITPTPMGPVINFVQVYNMIEAWRGEDPALKKRNRELFTRERMQKLLEKSQSNHHP